LSRSRTGAGELPFLRTKPHLRPDSACCPDIRGLVRKRGQGGVRLRERFNFKYEARTC
jgi:hypothetical protein